MCKYFSLALILSFGLLGVSAQEQTPQGEYLLPSSTDTIPLKSQVKKKKRFTTIYSGGVKAEGNLSDCLLTGMDNTKCDPGVGANIGGFVLFELGYYFAIQLELIFQYQTTSFDVAGQELNLKAFSMEIPMYAIAKKRLSNLDRIYIGMGPNYSIGIFGRDNGMNYYRKENLTNPDDIHLQRIDIGVGVIVGYEFWYGLQINASYRMGLMNALGQKGSQLELPSMQRNVISLGVGYRFM
ncbi:MAG: porin family protein [Bacteroidales bacterium]